jgi:signal transduction histidine kinase
MRDNETAALEERVLLLAPTRRDAAAAAKVFESEGITLTVCKDISEICIEIEKGAAVAIVPDEAIHRDLEGHLARVLGNQPSWSDFPLIVLTHTRQTAALAVRLESVGHMTLIPRPVEVRSLTSTVQAALRDRKRQYARRDDLALREQQAKVLREADRRKDEFLAMLSHELRNPLAAVNNAITVLKMSPDEESRNWASDVVERQVRQLVRLVDDLLDVSRISSGKIRLRKAYVDAHSILNQAIESARPAIEEREQTLSVSIEECPLPLHVDATRVEQIVVNLLNNAAKYTDRGGHIWLTATTDGDWVVIGVRDNGIGIPPERLPEMFKLFAQGERTLARSEGGLGIGLTIVQNLTEMHGGSVVARSEGAGQGSEFIVRLPLVRRPESAGAESPSGPTAARQGSRILVVDDSVDTARGMVRLLKLLGNDAIAVHDGQTALETAVEFRPEFVLLDLGLPGMDGFEVVTAMRGEASLKNAVIIAISGYGRDEDRRRSRAAGFDHHLVKPIDFDSLISLMAARAV